MATLPSSGAISLANIQSVMGGANPISISEYYRGGGLTPSTRTTTVTEGPFYSLGSPFYYWSYSSSFPGYNNLYWAGSSVALFAGALASSYTTGGYTYFRGAFQTSSKGGVSYYAISRQYSSTVNINTSVPTSGVISFSNFYGAAKP